MLRYHIADPQLSKNTVAMTTVPTSRDALKATLLSASAV
jgi:hypothetical protein